MKVDSFALEWMAFSKIYILQFYDVYIGTSSLAQH